MTMPAEPAANPAVNDPSITDPTMRRIAELEGQRTQQLAITTDPGASMLAKQAAQAQVAKLEPALSAAYRDAASNERALAKLATPGGVASTPAAMMQAAAAQSRADAMTTRADAYAEGTGNKRAQLEADAKLKDAQAQVATAQAGLATATQPDEIQKAHVALQQATESLKTTQAANTAAGLNNDILGAKAAVAPQVEKATADTATATATTAQATAANAVQQSAATLTKAQSDASSAQLAYQDAQANFDALTPEMRSQAAQNALDTKRTALDQANENLKLARDAHQTVLAQGQANLAQTQATTQAGLLGPLYGAQQKAAEITAMLKAGTITDPAQAHQMLQDYITSAMRGTTPYQQQQDALSTETARRGQDSSLAGQQMSTAGSLGSSLFSSMAAANKDAPAGSSAMAQSYGGMMGVLMNELQRQRGSVSPANSPLLQSMSTRGGVPPPQAPMAPPAPAAPTHTTTVGPDGSVTVGPAAGQVAPVAPIPPTPQIPLLGPGQAGTGQDPNTGGPQNPAFLGGMGPAMPNHVDALWQNDPNLNPLNSQSLAA